VEAIGADAVPARMVRDRDAIYGAEFDTRVDHLGIEQLRIAPRSPWQNGFAERWVGTLRRDLLDHLIVLGDRHCSGWSASMLPITTRTDLTCRSIATRQSHAPSNRPAVVGSSHFRASVASTTVIRGRRDLPNQLFATTPP
jgi:transposase InsO family protein